MTDAPHTGTLGPASLYREYLDFAVDLAIEAGRLTRNFFGQGPDALEMERKPDRSPVTRADRDTETHIRNRIRTHYPHHAIIGEELGEEAGSTRWCWYIDPIDGTEAFVHGIPLYTVLIALVEGNEPRVGVIHNPISDETIYAAPGAGCRLNDKPCHVSNCEQMSEARLLVSDMAECARRQPVLLRTLLPQVALGRTWADAYGYLLLASGRADIMLDATMKSWDIAPLYPIIEEAGGTIRDLSGRRNPLGTSAVACTRTLADPLQKIIDTTTQTL